MSEVALHDVDRGAGVEQGCGLGVTQAVAVGIAQGPSAGVPQRQHRAELAQYSIVMAGYPGPGALAVPGELGEQVAYLPVRPKIPALADPGLLLADDLDDIGADQDGRRRP